MDAPLHQSDPTITTLTKAGLTQSQAKGYLALIEYGSLTPAALAEHTGESRTNGYMICEKLASLGLANKKDGKTVRYTPNHPSALETLAEKRRKIVTRNEYEVKQSLSPLIDLFYQHTEQPGTRTLQGVAGIKEVYADTLRTGQDIYLLRTIADGPTLGDGFFEKYRQDRANKGINTYALTPMTDISYQNLQSGDDKKHLFHRTPLPDGAYTAPVEVDVYGNKVALISFGDTQMATIIESPAIAEAMRQILTLLRSTLTK